MISPFVTAHLSFLGEPQGRGPISVSVVKEDNSDSYKAVIRTSSGNVRVPIPKGTVKPSWWRKIFGTGPSPSGILLYQ